MAYLFPVYGKVVVSNIMTVAARVPTSSVVSVVAMAYLDTLSSHLLSSVSLGYDYR
jgi:hypothetical protein